MHPLMGASLPTLLSGLQRNGGVHWRALPQTCAFTAAALGRLPFTLLERYVIHPQSKVDAYLETPVFIIGHWRSGTTHLHNLMGASGQYGIITPLASGLPNELLTLATWLRPFLEKSLPQDRGVDKVAVTPSSPQEDEIPLANMQPLSIYHATYFARHFDRLLSQGVFFEGVTGADIERWKQATRYFLSKVARQQKNPRLLIKNPVYTARIGELRTIWPDAKFIHIYRNPYTVFDSTVHYFRKMLDMLALQDATQLDIEAMALALYPRLLQRLDSARADLPTGDFAEMRFEDLESNPLKELARIHRELSLPGWETARPAIERYLSALQNYTKNTFAPDPATTEKVQSHWGEYIERWGYEAPVASRT